MKSLLFALPLLGCVDAADPQLLPDGGTASLYAATEDTDLWSDGIVHYCLDEQGLGIPAMQGVTEAPLRTGGDPCLVREAIADLSVVGGFPNAECPDVSVGRGLTPLMFVESDCATLEAGTDEFIRYVGGTTPTGLDTTSPHHARGFTIVLPTFHMRSVEHETGHALGLIHEHQRRDRDAHVAIDMACRRTSTDPKTDKGIVDQLNIRASKLLTPYDPSSVMQYASFSFSSDEDHAPYTSPSCPATPVSTNVNTCPTMLFEDDAPSGAKYCTDFGLRDGVYHDKQTLGLSPEDVNALYQLYEIPHQGTCFESERMGETLAGGDLDGDGYADLAMRIDNSVRLYKGTMNGLVWWRTLGSDLGGSSSDQFGAALVTGPGGKLYVGAPGYNGGKGAVFVFQPAAARVGVTNGIAAKPSTGPVLQARIDAPSGETRFGRSLALGAFTSASAQELAIGAANGNVEIVHTGSSFLHAAAIAHAGADDGFANELAAGDLDGDGIDELAVGAPSASVKGAPNGIVYIYLFSGAAPGTPKQVYEASPAGTSDRFGAALRIGKWNGLRSLLVGAPGAGPGRVVTFAWDAAQQRLTNRGMDVGSADGDLFGSAIRLGDMDGNNVPDLIVGAPGANVHGTVSIFRDAGGGSSILNGQADDLGFGAAIGIANFDRTGKPSGHADTLDLAIGAPRTKCSGNANAGAVTLFLQSPDHPLEPQLARRFTLEGALPASVIP